MFVYKMEFLFNKGPNLKGLLCIYSSFHLFTARNEKKKMLYLEVHGKVVGPCNPIFKYPGSCRRVMISELIYIYICLAFLPLFDQNKNKNAIQIFLNSVFQCSPLTGLGFRRGSYTCVCRPGFYFPDTQAKHKYYNGTILEEEYEKILMVGPYFL